MSVFRLISAVKKQIIAGRLLIQCRERERARERNTPEKLRRWLISLLVFRCGEMEIERRAGMRRANCGEAVCDWLRPRPRPARLDMGIYWRQAHQSAPHLINEPQHCVDRDFSHVCAVFLFGWSSLQQVSGGIACASFFFLFLHAKYAVQKVLKLFRRIVYLLLQGLGIKQGYSPRWIGIEVNRLFNVFSSSLCR